MSTNIGVGGVSELRRKFLLFYNKEEVDSFYGIGFPLPEDPEKIVKVVTTGLSSTSRREASKLYAEKILPMFSGNNSIFLVSPEDERGTIESAIFKKISTSHGDREAKRRMLLEEVVLKLAKKRNLPVPMFLDSGGESGVRYIAMRYLSNTTDGKSVSVYEDICALKKIYTILNNIKTNNAEYGVSLSKLKNRVRTKIINILKNVSLSEYYFQEKMTRQYKKSNDYSLHSDLKECIHQEENPENYEDLFSRNLEHLLIYLDLSYDVNEVQKIVKILCPMFLIINNEKRKILSRCDAYTYDDFYIKNESGAFQIHFIDFDKVGYEIPGMALPQIFLHGDYFDFNTTRLLIMETVEERLKLKNQIFGKKKAPTISEIERESGLLGCEFDMSTIYNAIHYLGIASSDAKCFPDDYQKNLEPKIYNGVFSSNGGFIDNINRELKNGNKITPLTIHPYKDVELRMKKTLPYLYRCLESIICNESGLYDDKSREAAKNFLLKFKNLLSSSI